MWKKKNTSCSFEELRLSECDRPWRKPYPAYREAQAVPSLSRSAQPHIPQIKIIMY
ncbi:hypothetical protein F7734_17610 [Scytonema sp. UIC 10036]|uniref:hypothetical protein n=1 Tax=Scytonema sp. UIC 10036 TaxID=2304196 RepID=UPI0012DA892C|nr:hypothetical protein [Scytonema sp. UIC 10036]MUG94109.1 hypothetical protein [Scytonema sp. UIC 10036]